MNNAESMAYWATITDPTEALKILCENSLLLGNDPYYRDLSNALMDMAARAAQAPSARDRAREALKWDTDNLADPTAVFRHALKEIAP